MKLLILYTLLEAWIDCILGIPLATTVVKFAGLLSCSALRWAVTLKCLCVTFDRMSHTFLADKCFGMYQGGCPLQFRECGQSNTFSRQCGDCLEGYYQLSAEDPCLGQCVYCKITIVESDFKRTLYLQ